MSIRQQLEEELEQAARDLADVARQREAGELSEADAVRLSEQYRSEHERVSGELAGLADEPPPAKIGTRTWWLAGLTVLALAVVGFFVTQSIDDRPAGGFVSGNLETGRDLDSVSNEEMEATIEQFPDIIGMRAALARRYFEAGDFSSATRHYLEILDRDPNHPEALANLGWMTFTSDGGPEADAAAVNLLERSLQALPGNPDALFFLANIRLTEGDGEAAAALLNDLLQTGVVGEDDRPLIDELLSEADRMATQNSSDQ